ncbi:MAG TPA: GNAT family N-acetyltransferase [Gaiellaceae bacterium]|jgi:GNAT superfamily N-acetyltransferase|nr:GNAT family N-acetyltransferase [Gaiellaceae bacterium]
MALIDLARDDPAAVALIARLPALGAAATGNSKLIGWDENGEVAGAVVVARRDDTVELRYLAVLPEQRGQGIGRTLVTALADVVNAAELTAEADAESAPFFAACGFATTRLERPGRETYSCVLPLEAVPSPQALAAITLEALEAAVREGWSRDTAENPDAWSPDNPARDHCDVTALLVRELLGGEILIANVIHEGRRVERHAWNRLPSGLTIDLTRSQFKNGEQFDAPRPGEPMTMLRAPERYARFAERVYATLGCRPD